MQVKNTNEPEEFKISNSMPRMEDNKYLNWFFCELTPSEMKRVTKAGSTILAYVVCVISGLIRISFCWHPELFPNNLDNKASEYQEIDLPVSVGALIITPTLYSYRNSINTIFIFGSGIISFFSLAIKLLKPDKPFTIFFRLMLGVGMGLVDYFIIQYLRNVTMKSKQKCANLASMFKNTGVAMGAALFLFTDRNYYEIIFLLATLAMILFRTLCIETEAAPVTEVGGMKKKIAAMLTLFGAFFVMQGVFGQNMLLCYDSLIYPEDFVLFSLFYGLFATIYHALKYKYFNMTIKPWIIYFSGIMVCLISQCLISLEYYQKAALFVLLLTYNVFIESLPELGLSGLIQNDGERLRYLISKTLVLATDVAAKVYSMLSEKEELKNLIHFMVVITVLLNGIFHVIYTNNDYTNQDPAEI